ncbi:MAG: hypothetical protein IJB51_04540 [Clostridia bacterium]|nr:hypothetical protein [Clostridia bacterium]
MEELLTFIREELPEADQQVAEGVVLFLHQRRATFTRDLGYWKTRFTTGSSIRESVSAS